MMKIAQIPAITHDTQNTRAVNHENMVGNYAVKIAKILAHTGGSQALRILQEITRRRWTVGRASRIHNESTGQWA